MTLGSHIAALRAAKNLSQAELAELLEVSRQSVSKWETDASVPDLDKLLRLSQIFGLTLDDLVLGDLPEPEGPVETVQPPATVSDSPRQPPRIMVGSVLLLFGSLVALIFSLRGDPLIVVLSIALPFLICGVVCLLVKKHILLWCGWCILIPLHFSAIGYDVGSVVSLLLPLPALLPPLLVLCTAWTLRHRLWGSPQYRSPLVGAWLFSAVVCLIMRTLGYEFYGTVVTWLPRSARLHWQLLGHVLLLLSTLLTLALCTVALSALFYCVSAFLRKRRSPSSSFADDRDM